MVTSLRSTRAFKTIKCDPTDPNDPWVLLHAMYKEYSACYSFKKKKATAAGANKFETTPISKFKLAVTTTWFRNVIEFVQEKKAEEESINNLVYEFYKMAKCYVAIIKKGKKAKQDAAAKKTEGLTVCGCKQQLLSTLS